MILFLCLNLQKNDVRLIWLQNYLENEPCEGLKSACKVQNSTHNGIIMPSIGPCSCCQICIENLKLGDDCSVGGLGSPVPTGICGPGLYCTANEEDEHPTCQPSKLRPLANCHKSWIFNEWVFQVHDSSECFKAQKTFDEKRQDGTIGHLMQRPECNADGYFEPVVCIPGQT